MAFGLDRGSCFDLIIDVFDRVGESSKLVKRLHVGIYQESDEGQESQ